MKTYNVTIHLRNIIGDDFDEEVLKKSIKEAMQSAIELDESGEEELNYSFEEQEDEVNY